MALIDHVCSTDSVWRGSETERCLSDDLNAIQNGLAGKAASNYTHSGFAATSHNHAVSDVTGLQTASRNFEIEVEEVYT